MTFFYARSLRDGVHPSERRLSFPRADQAAKQDRAQEDAERQQHAKADQIQPPKGPDFPGHGLPQARDHIRPSQ